jgi:hypothetical protein
MIETEMLAGILGVAIVACAYIWIYISETNKQ